jgi:hypothetical protein
MGGISKVPLKCHADLVIPDGLTTNEQPSKPDGSASQEVIGRYRATGFIRWYPGVFAVAWLLLGTAQFVQTRQWRDLAFAAAWTALAVMAWVPKTVISERGVRFAGRRTIPWSQVVDVVARPNNRWTQRPPELVLLDGRRKRLLELNDSQVEALRSLARKNGASIRF